MVRLLLNLGANIEVKNGEHGETVLHRAARNANKAVVQFLLHHGADIQAKDRCGWTPLYYAKLCGNADVERLLLDRGAADFVDPRDIFSS
ncbi:ankyrin repeat protein [Wilcoxina mikolae CBS 423.85]|nr:ankyrin repeat protein [Wilcoxina mikolae CBS 423.85]